MTDNNQALMTSKQAGSELGYSVTTISHFCVTKQLEGIKVETHNSGIPFRWMIYQSSVFKFKAQLEQKKADRKRIEEERLARIADKNEKRIVNTSVTNRRSLSAWVPIEVYERVAAKAKREGTPMSTQLERILEMVFKIGDMNLSQF
jgi:hypothetical protein